MIDLHTHTTASDGTCSPEELVARAAAAGVTVLAVTDHDTTAGLAEAAAASAAQAIRFVDGIEITAVCDGADVHVLGYFFDRASPALAAFLERQRQVRVERDLYVTVHEDIQFMGRVRALTRFLFDLFERDATYLNEM